MVIVDDMNCAGIDGIVMVTGMKEQSPFASRRKECNHHRWCVLDSRVSTFHVEAQNIILLHDWKRLCLGLRIRKLNLHPSSNSIIIV